MKRGRKGEREREGECVNKFGGNLVMPNDLQQKWTRR
jgi:hypothetical protein